MRRLAKKKRTTPKRRNLGLSDKELMCLTRQLIVQQRQSQFKETADIGEACGGCKYLDSCLSSKFVFDELYKMIANEAGVNVGFRIGFFPLVTHRI